MTQGTTLQPYRLNRHDIWNMLAPPPAEKEKGEFKIAALNVQTAWVTDSANNLAKYPQYEWKNRLKPITQLILLDKPTILCLTEPNLKQVQDLRSALGDYGYKIAGYSQQTRESIEVVEEKIARDENYFYNEFVGFAYDSNEVILEESHCVELERGERHNRILAVGKFFLISSKVNFYVLSMHFDHLSRYSREKSGKQELAIIRKLEEAGSPWFSIGDRNWFFDRGGPECAEEYIKLPFICDFRDTNEQGHYGPSGSYPGHLGLPKQCEPPIQVENGVQHIEAETFDVGFRSRNSSVSLNSYAYSGEFSPESYDLLPVGMQGDLSKKNFVSDHYLVGGTFRFI